MAQLLVTFGMVAVFTLHPDAKMFAQRNPQLLFLSMIVTFVVMMAMACCTSVRREAPMNFIFLGIFTVAEGLLLGVFSSYMEGRMVSYLSFFLIKISWDILKTDVHCLLQVLMAVGITAAICFSLTLFAFQTKVDFTGAGPYLFAAAICFMIFGFILIFFTPGKTVHLVYSSIGALLFSFYLVYDTQMMMGGNHKYSVSPEEYIFAALSLYLDIVNIFIYILSILQATSND